MVGVVWQTTFVFWGTKHFSLVSLFSAEDYVRHYQIKYKFTHKLNNEPYEGVVDLVDIKHLNTSLWLNPYRAEYGFQNESGYALSFYVEERIMKRRRTARRRYSEKYSKDTRGKDAPDYVPPIPPRRGRNTCETLNVNEGARERYV